MFRSIGRALFWWYAVILLLVVGGFGAMLYQNGRQAALSRVDAELVGAARMLGGSLDKEKKEHGGPSLWNWGKGKGGPPHEKGPKEARPKGPPPVKGPADDRGKKKPDHSIVIPSKYLHIFKVKREDALYFVIWKGKGERLAASADDLDVPFPQDGRPKSPELREYNVRERDGFREVILAGPQGTHILVGKPMHLEHAQLDSLLVSTTGTGVAVLLVGLAGGWFLCRRTLRPIERITRVAESISASSLSRRIDVSETESELGRLARVLNDAFTRLQESFEQQARFTADASHELRTPITVIYSQAEHALSKDRSAAEYREALEASFRAARRMKVLAEDLLTLARADAGQLVLNQAPFDLAQTAEDCAAILEPVAAEKGITVNLALRHAPVVGDAERMAEVVTNLLTNAIKYTDRNGRIDLHVQPEGEAIVLRVRDTGVGISGEDQVHVFERFYRVDRARSREQGGSGLGLAICKQIVDAHGGSIRVDSSPGEGSTFTVELPRAPAPVEPVADERLLSVAQ